MVSKLILLCLPFCLGLSAQIDLDLSDLQGDSKAADTFYIRDVEHPVLGPSNCQFSEIKRCNKKFKDNFHNIGTVRNQGNHTVYCNGVQSFVTCLTRSNCRGPFIGNYSYVVLQHAMMDKKLNICPHHRYGKLKTRLKAVEEKHKLIDSISEDEDDNCSLKVHKSCVDLFTQNMKTNSNMCQDVEKFITCYVVSSKLCRAKIVQRFAHLCAQLGKQMLKANEIHKGMMC
ncbi:uncharacterized protein LOC5502819 [Nematostella vectensis]|uniref:uncharacterized protein LOC5502819 n=1 Tax=Nematostella vectensis TaxID=45351 RepID=UPI0020772318|nr:uncharacterized protein LOC5502819 [Nematostella vectensis]